VADGGLSNSTADPLRMVDRQAITDAMFAAAIVAGADRAQDEPASF